MNISFRRAHLHDPQEIRFICEIDSTIPPLFDTEFLIDEAVVQSRIKEYTEKLTDDDFFDVAVTDTGRVVGFHILHIKPHFKNAKKAMVHTLWVAENFRKQKIAQTLKNRAESWAKFHKLNHIETWVSKKNENMIKLNQNLGFEIVNYKMRKNIIGI